MKQSTASGQVRLPSTVGGQRLAAWLVGLAILTATDIASGAQSTLLDVLRQKSILTDEEYRSLQRASAGDAALLDILKAKGVITAAEYESVKPATAQRAAPTGRAAIAAEGTVMEDRATGLKVRLSGRVHSDYRSYDTRTTSRTTNTAEVRRARLGVEAEFGDWLDAEVTGDFESTTKVDTAYINFRLADAAQLRLGLFKMPFSLEQMTSSNFTDFQERSLANAQAPGKERGVMVHGRPGSGLYYGLALSNGNADADTDDNDGKDRIGRLAVNAAEWSGNKDMVIHVGVAASRGSRPVGDVGFNGRTEARGFRFFDPAAFTGAPVGVRRNGIEAALAWGPVKLQSELISTTFDGASAGGVAYDREMSAHYISATWLVTGEHYADAYKNGVFRNIRPRSELRASRGGRGAVELGLRYSKFDASDFRPTNPAGTGVLGAGLTSGADAWTLGLKWILNPYSRLMVNLVQTSFDTPVAIGGAPAARERAVLLRGQVNF